MAQVGCDECMEARAAHNPLPAQALCAKLCLIALLTSQSLQDYVLGNKTDTVGVLVRAGLHEVDLFKRRMKPCYNPGTIHRAIRGTWFVDKGTGYAPVKVCFHSDSSSEHCQQHRHFVGHFAQKHAVEAAVKNTIIHETLSLPMLMFLHVPLPAPNPFAATPSPSTLPALPSSHRLLLSAPFLHFPLYTLFCVAPYRSLHV